jgi:DNA-binding MarR family transcriptional regulator
MPARESRVMPLPETAPSAENAFRALIQTLGLAERVLQPHFGRFGISGSQWSVLRALHQAEEDGLSGLRLTDLSESLLVRPPSVTGAVDRLQRAGLVWRAGVHTDHRAKLVGLTPEGRRLVDRVRLAHAAQVEAVMGGLTPEEQSELQRLLARLGEHFEGLLEGNDDPGRS